MDGRFLDVECPIKTAGALASGGCTEQLCSKTCAWFDQNRGGCTTANAANAVRDVMSGVLGLNEAGGFAPILHVREVGHNEHLAYDDDREEWEIKRDDE